MDDNSLLKDFDWKKVPPPTILDKLAGPYEWGYRDPTDGTFIKDETPFEAFILLQKLFKLIYKLKGK